LDVLGSCIFGKDFNFFDGYDKGPLYHYNSFLKGMRKTSLFQFMPTWIFNAIPFGNVKNMRLSAKEIDKYINTIRQEAIENNDGKNNSLLHMLVEANSDHKLSNQALRDNIIVFFIAGHETTATSLLYILYHLALRPDYQERVREEINRIFPKNIDTEGLKELSFTLNVINESLRLHPPLGALTRVSKGDDTVAGDLIIPKNTILNLFGFGIQKDNDTWGDDGDDFNPDRFDHLTKDQAQALFPFGGGPRICIGNTFSLYEQKIFLAKFFKKFKISLEPDSKLVVTNLLSSPMSELLKFKLEQL